MSRRDYYVGVFVWEKLIFFNFKELWFCREANGTHDANADPVVRQK